MTTDDLKVIIECLHVRQVPSVSVNANSILPRAKLLFMRARESLNFGDSYTCTYCLKVIKWDHHRTRPTKDHFFPKSKKKLLMGAKTSFIICCQPCNSRKSDKVFCSIEEVREFIASRKKAIGPNIDRN